MPNPIVQKTFRMELEFTVTMNELEGEHPGDSAANRRLSFLKLLQKAVVQNEPALIRQLLGAVLNKLQDYVDYLSGQNTLLSLSKVAAALPPEERAYLEETHENFADLTRPLRITSISTRLEHSTIQETTGSDECASGAKPVWDDLRQGTEYGRLLEKYSNPLNQPAYGLETSHFLMVRYLTRQPDGVHCEARCTCGAVLEGIGADESGALEALWSRYKKHTEFNHLTQKAKSSVKRLFSKN